MKRRILSLLLCLFLFTGLFPFAALASTDWPGDVSIEADAGIIMDAHSGAVIYGKNIHSTFSPASITKVLTALIALERCSMDDVVTFSQNAVYNVESNSSSAGYDVGDQATVEDLLYALLLKSANEAANALAEHISGSTEEFAKLMNETAASLGCQDSNFSNPSGLNDDSHYVSAYDMALITRRAFEDERFCKIVSTTYYELPPNKQNPEGQGISPGNKMVKKNWPDQYRADVIGGKTGFTSIALNTLVICAEQKDTRFVTVILHSQGTQYDDTKRLLDFGFRNFQSVKISDYDKTYSSIGEDLKINGLPTSQNEVLTVDPESRVILPKTADFSETTALLDYNLPAAAPPGAIACVNYTLGERPIGQAYLTLSKPMAEARTALPEALLEAQPTVISSSPESGESALGEGVENGLTESGQSGKAGMTGGSGVPGPSGERMAAAPSEPESKRLRISLKIPSLFWKILLAVLAVSGVSCGTYFYVMQRRRKEEEERQRRRQRRAERLKETGISEAEFNLLMQKMRSGESKGSPARQTPGKKPPGRPGRAAGTVREEENEDGN